MVKRIILIVAIFLSITLLDFLGIHYYSRYLVGFEKTFVASHQLSQRSRITENDLEEIEIPKGFISSDVLTVKEEILDNYVKLSYSIPKGSFIYKSAIEKDNNDISNTLLFKNQVTYDVLTSEAKINSGSLAKNMYVDLYLTISIGNKPISDLLLSDARIIGLYDINQKPILDFDKESRVYIVSLAVDREDVNYLNMAFALGEIKVVVSDGAYETGKKSRLNTESEIFEYLK